MSIIGSLPVLVRRINLCSMHFFSRLETPKHVHNISNKIKKKKITRTHAHICTETHIRHKYLCTYSNKSAREVNRTAFVRIFILHFSFHFFFFLLFLQISFFNFCMLPSTTCLRFLRGRLSLLLFVFLLPFSRLHHLRSLRSSITNSQLVLLRDRPNVRKNRPRRKKKGERDFDLA